MSDTPRVREVTVSDLAQIVPLFLASLDTSLPGVTFSDQPEYEPETVHSNLRGRLFPPRSLKTYVLELPSSGEILGYGNVKPAVTPGEDERAGESKAAAREERDELDMFFVKVGHEGRGYGGLLMAAIRREWTHRGGLQLHVFKRNTRAIRFYEKMGFRVVEGGETRCAIPWNGPVEETVVLMHWDPSSC